MGSMVSVQKIAAQKIGVSYNKYLEKIKDFKWCWKCKSWKLPMQFNKNKNLRDGLSSVCQECSRVKQKVNRKCFHTSKNQKQKARDTIRWAIKRGRLIKPNACPCFYCGKQANQYHHYRGYGDSNLLDVRAACSKCHINQHWDN